MDGETNRGEEIADFEQQIADAMNTDSGSRLKPRWGGERAEKKDRRGMAS